MEITSNVIALQCVLTKCLKQIGDFTIIRHQGGNEKSILHLITELTSFLIERGLYKPKQTLEKQPVELQELIFLLALNTDFDRRIALPNEYCHLIGVIPSFSKYLLTKTCFALNVVECLGFVIENLPVELTREILDQAIQCLKVKEPLDNTCIILKAVINKVSLSESGSEFQIDDLRNACAVILQNLTGICANQLESIKTQKIYHQIGFTLLQLLELLLYIEEKKNIPNNFGVPFIGTSCILMECVTLDVFCSWVEINYHHQCLQIVIAEKAYLVSEKYLKHKEASELISMLSNIARKPKTIAELIQDADIPTIIHMVDEKDEHQMLWFRSLFNMSIFNVPAIVKCIERWYELIDDNTFAKMLSQPLPKDPKHRQLIIKCALHMPLENLTKVLTTYFIRDKFEWKEDITEQLITTFNQLHDNITDKELGDMLLLLLQNAAEFFRHLYLAGFKRSSNLVRIFEFLKEISKVEQIGVNVLMDVLHISPPSSENVTNYVQLFRVLLNTQYFSWNFMVHNIIFSLLKQYQNEDTLEEFICCLQILRYFQDEKCDLPTEIQIIEYLLTRASNNRCISFLKFDVTKMKICSLSVDWILHKCHHYKHIEGKKESFPDLGLTLNNPWSQYYKELFWSTGDVSLTNSVLPNFDWSDYQEGVLKKSSADFMKNVPCCVESEWKILLNELVAKYGFKLISNAVTDIIISLCMFAGTQSSNESTENAIKFCLQNYGAFIVSGPSTNEEHLLSVKNVCRVLQHIPNEAKETEGMCLINALPDEVLKSLANDKDFVVNNIQHLDDQGLRKALAQRILASTRRID
ncbi:uncharacterized protein [Euwallacea fornicatus]|uniref:uncharacterized protein isoform X1 n=1 Tax=Euwallacea fornicatus TaxID=995702 RepID=UPI00338E2A9C